MALDYPDGMPRESDGNPVLMFNGVRVYDACDIPALSAMAHAAVLVERKWITRLAADDLPSTAVSRHVEETGHRLRQGCCAGRRAVTQEPEYMEETCREPT